MINHKSPIPFEKRNQSNFNLELFHDNRNKNFDDYVLAMKEFAAKHSIKWEIRLDQKGIALSGEAWDLRAMLNDGRPKTAVLKNFSLYSQGLDDIAEKVPGKTRHPDGPISHEWQDFLKALVIDYRIIRKKSTPFITALGTAIRYLAAVSNKEPWLLTTDDVQLTCDLADIRQPAKGSSTVLRGMISTIFDPLHLSFSCPLMGLLRRNNQENRNPRSKFSYEKDKLSKKLAERKSEEKLPERRAFWELIRIVFTEKPKTLNDALRFSMVKILLFCGFRIGSVALIPLDWKRIRNYVDSKGKPAGQSGGISESLVLRHFPSKQGTQDLYEDRHDVVHIFRDELEKTLNEVERLTSPLRETLKAQCDSKRIFPMYCSDQLVDALEMYVRLTGNPVWTASPPSSVKDAIKKYLDSFDASELIKIQELQRCNIQLSAAVSRYFSAEKRKNGLILRDANGNIDNSRGVKDKFLLISEVENYIQKFVKTKMPDWADFTLANGEKLSPWNMLFLMPKRAVGAGRGDSVVDPYMSFSVGLADESLLQVALGDTPYSDYSLFSIYGKTDEDRKLKIKTHSFRHLQNSELFRLGIADTIITKRFNRRSVAESYNYDHRSLAEEMDQLELPEAWTDYLGESSKALNVAKLIHAGRTDGPIVREFRNIQSNEGDESALRFLAAEADGFHATPYGYCINSFTVDPCPKHLECFNNCRHLSATNLEKNQQNLIKLHGKMKVALEMALARPSGSIGRSNQIAHASERIRGIEKLLNAKNGEIVFPDGVDLSQAGKTRSVLSGT